MVNGLNPKKNLNFFFLFIFFRLILGFNAN
jgi:hypothetical protein